MAPPPPLMAVLASSIAATAAETSHSWSAFETDFNALGGAAISVKYTSYMPPAEEEVVRKTIYQVTVPQAGKIDLFMRSIPGGFYISQTLGETSQWREVKNIKGVAGEYTSSMVKDDRPELALMQNIPANGGIRGRRAFFGRFTLQAFGIPTAARKEPGHATLAHWHPAGWATRLGGQNKPGESWGPGGRGFCASMNDSRTRHYRADVNFHASSKAREDATAFMRVKRAQWIGALLDEQPKPGLITWSGRSRGPAPLKKGEVEKPVFWNELALHEQRRINAGRMSAESASSVTAAVAAKEPAAAGKVTSDDNGFITIPEAACSSPAESNRSLSRGGQSDLIVFVRNNPGDAHLHLPRCSKEGDTFEYAFDAPMAGKYQLVAGVVPPKWDQRLFAMANGGTPVEIALPRTIGMWDKTAPVVTELKADRNILKFHGPARVTLGQVTLTPMQQP